MPGIGVLISPLPYTARLARLTHQQIRTSWQTGPFSWLIRRTRKWECCIGPAATCTFLKAKNTAIVHEARNQGVPSPRTPNPDCLDFRSYPASALPVQSMPGCGAFIGSPQWLTDEQWGRLLELLGAHRSAVDELSLFTNEAMGWFGTMDEMARDSELMARRIREAHAAGYRSVGINVLCTLGHGDPVGEWSPEFRLPRTMGHDGQQATHCPCPNSVPFREHIKAKYQLFARTKPDFIWVDDDLRQSHHSVTYPCFCPICLGRFGRGNDRAALVKRMNDPAEIELRRAWVEFNAATLESLCKDIGDAVREVDSSIELGLMTIGSSHSTYGGHAIDRWTAALGAVRGRPGHGFYWTTRRAASIARRSTSAGRRATIPQPSPTCSTSRELPLRGAGQSRPYGAERGLPGGDDGLQRRGVQRVKATTGTLEDFQPLVAAIAAERPAWESLIAHVAGLPAVGFWPADDNALMGKPPWTPPVGSGRAACITSTSPTRWRRWAFRLRPPVA